MAERDKGIFIDYGKSLHTTVADLIRRYIKEELPRQKGGEDYRYVLQAMLDDSELTRTQPTGEKPPRDEGPSGNSKSVHATMESLEWLHRPLNEVVAADIVDWMRSRESDVKLSTIWRQYENVRAVINLADKTWGYPFRVNPTKGVRKLDFQNERDRRLVEGEFERLMAAAQRWDAEKSLEARVQQLVQERLAGQTFSSKSQRKHRMAALRHQLTPLARETCVHRPLMEAFILFQLATGARRGESLTLPWSEIKFEKKTAYLAETKNGLSRSLALRDDLIELLRELPREGELVFGLTVKTCRTAWAAIVEAAGIEDLNIHDLRHEAISAAADTGLSLAELQAFSGHRDNRMLLRYLHLNMSHLAEKLSAALASGTLKNGRRRLDPKVLTMRDLREQSAPADESPPPTVAPALARAEDATQPQPSAQVIPFPVKQRQPAATR